MKLSLQITDHTVPGAATELRPTLTAIARAADSAGFAGIAVGDHLWQHPYLGGPEADLLECYSTLSFLAAHTEHADLLALVTSPVIRQPGLLAKTVTTLDVLSSGRAWLGIGAGHYPDDMRGLGIPYPPLGERYEMLEETLRFCQRMWDGESGDQGAFTGRHYQAGRLLNRPQSLRRPRPPIIVAGTGEQKTLRLVAAYADACSLRPGPDIPDKLDVLRRHCDAVGRDYDTIEKTCVFRFDVGPDGEGAAALVEQLGAMSASGIQHVYGSIPQQHLVTPLEAIGAEVIPAIAAW